MTLQEMRPGELKHVFGAITRHDYLGEAPPNVHRP
jgi:hypothetical protein